MTFVLKDFKELKKDFDDAVAKFLVAKKVTNIDDLPSHRKNHLLFLQTTLHHIEQQIADRPDRGQNYYTGQFYAAIHLAKIDLVKGLSSYQSETGSYLIKCLDVCLAISEKNKPEPRMLASWYAGLNELFNVVYINNDSRNGLNKEHIYAHIEPAKISGLIKLACETEEEANAAALTSIQTDGKTKANPNTYRMPAADAQTVAGVIAKFNSFDKFKEELRVLINAELGAKKAGDAADLGQARGIQIQFLEQLVKSFEKAPDSKHARVRLLSEQDKIAILAGAMHIVRSQIAVSYRYTPLCREQIPATLVYTKLSAILHAFHESPENVELLVSITNQYIRHMAFETEQSKSQGTEIVRAEHLFSAIEDFSLPTVLKNAETLIRECRITALHDAVKAAYPKEQKSVASYIPSLSSFASFWPASTKKAAAKPTEEEEDITHKDDAPEEETAAASSSMSAQ